MARLPVPGSDNGTWGDILNDYLSVEHNADGTQKTLDVSKGGTGAVTASAARTNLGAVADSDARLSDARLTVKKADVNVGTRRNLNLIEGSNITITANDDSGNDEVEVTIAGQAGGPLSGSGAPSNGLGTDGQFYIDTDNARLYGPKAGGAWPGTYTDLVGPQGADTPSELGYAELASNFTTTDPHTTPQDVPGMTTTVTVGARPIMVKFYGMLVNAAAGSFSVAQIKEGGTTLAECWARAAINNDLMTSSAEVRLAPSPGVHTYHIQLASTGATAATLASGATNKAFIQVYEI